MARSIAKVGWKLTTLGVVLPAGIMAKKMLAKAWVKTRHSEPPSNPATPGVSVPEALAWAAVSGVVYGAARLVAGRTVARAWQAVTGSLPPGLEDRVPDEDEE